MRWLSLAALGLAGLAQAVTCQNGIPAGNPDSVYVADPVQGTVTDSRTGLMWKTCVEEQTWDGATCVGNARQYYAWSEALALAEMAAFAGHDDWRLPNINELSSLTEPCRSYPSINETLFPNTPSSYVWSGSPHANYSYHAWSVYFGYGYAGYSSNRSGDGGVRLVRARQPFDTFALTVSKAGTGGGIVTSTPAGIDCGTTCAANFPAGTASVTLAATPDADSTFAGWGGDCTGTADCTLTLSAPRTVTATFNAALPSYRLAVSTAGAGSVASAPPGIDCGTVCTANFDGGTAVTLTATPASGYAFASWSGCDPVPVAPEQCTLTLTANAAVLATFAPIEPAVYRLNVATTGNGTVTSDPSGIDCGSACAADYAAGTAVTLTAAPDSGWQFLGWGGACTGTAPCILTLDGAREVTANFAAINTPYQLDSPVNGSFESGIGVVYGWVCDAAAVDLQIDAGAPLATAYGAERPDSQSVCGDTANGFAAAINWSEAGDGDHTLRLLADGVELTAATVTVTALGTAYLRDVTGSTAVPDFPAPGLSTPLTWSEPHQNFVVGSAAPATAPLTAQASGDQYWESPLPGGFESGRALLRGWACAAGTVSARLDGGPALMIPYGSARPDTQSVCGDSANGYALAINWNDSGDGAHQLALYLDDQLVETRALTLTSPGGQGTLTGVQRQHVVTDFPHPGDQVTLQWSEPHQNFRLIAYRPGTATGGATPGLYDPASGTFYLRHANAPGPADTTVRFGPGGAGWRPLPGDWDGDGMDTLGLYDPASGTFYLRDENALGSADRTFRFGPAGAGWQPLAGDWDGGGSATIGLYDPASGTFYLRHQNASGSADRTFRFGPAGAGWLPLAGDWDGDGVVTIGLYDPASGTFYLRNQNASGSADLRFRFGPAGAGWLPLAGDWDGGDVTTVGLYDPMTSTFYLRNQNAPGSADLRFRFGPAGAGWQALRGRWVP